MSVSSNPIPCFFAIFESSVEETNELATDLPVSFPLLIKYLPRITPTSSPRNILQFLDSSLIATAHLSASGSLAITKSASYFLAYSIARSITPFSSGFGKGVVGKFGSGRACSETSIGLENFAFSNTLTKVFMPTPWSAV